MLLGNLLNSPLPPCAEDGGRDETGRGRNETTNLKVSPIQLIAMFYLPPTLTQSLCCIYAYRLTLMQLLLLCPLLLPQETSRWLFQGWR